MMFATITLLFLSTAPILISSIPCNFCRNPIQVNYTVTSTTVPALPADCMVTNAPLCRASIFWDLDAKTTYLNFHDRPGMTTKVNAPIQDVVGVGIMKGMQRDNQTLSSFRRLEYECDSSDKCNGQQGLEKVLGALTVEDQFQQEIAPLLKIITPFSAREAGCLDFHNTTGRCPPPDLDRCRRCSIEADQLTTHSENICETCESEETRDNGVERFKTFVLGNQTLNQDFAFIGCQLKGCNTMSHVNLVYAASTITFNAEKYFKK
jgi:hypothetical protein